MAICSASVHDDGFDCVLLQAPPPLMLALIIILSINDLDDKRRKMQISSSVPREPSSKKWILFETKAAISPFKEPEST